MIPVTYFKALSDETRLRLFHVLCHYELNVNEIVEIMQMGQSRISHHLKILSDCGLLSLRRSGLWSFYSLVKAGDGKRFADSIGFLMTGQPVLEKDLICAREVIAERSRESERFFDSIAGDWGRMRRKILGEFDLSQIILESVGNTGVTVDLGCGSGGLLLALATRTETLIGVDCSTKMLREARKELALHNLKADLRIGEMEHLPLRDAEADTAIMNMVLHHLISPLTCIKEVGRILKVRGKLIIADFITHDNERMRVEYGDRWLGFSEKDIEHWLNHSNFRIEKNERFTLKQGLEMYIYNAEKI